ncbi:MAG: hypothetical protein HY397_02870 [Candidatus Doudnabacteria bacterium]|nr:hypothetical protein [Candidatus Doudnabacteria bacterium]
MNNSTLRLKFISITCLVLFVLNIFGWGIYLINEERAIKRAEARALLFQKIHARTESRAVLVQLFTKTGQTIAANAPIRIGFSRSQAFISTIEALLDAEDMDYCHDLSYELDDMDDLGNWKEICDGAFSD